MLLSLVKTFDFTLAVYEGFCYLKQVIIFFCYIFVFLNYISRVFNTTLLESGQL